MPVCELGAILLKRPMLLQLKASREGCPCAALMSCERARFGRFCSSPIPSAYRCLALAMTRCMRRVLPSSTPDDLSTAPELHITDCRAAYHIFRKALILQR